MKNLSKYEIYIPERLDGDYINILKLFQELSNIDNKLENGDKIIFNFENTRWIDAEMTTFLAMIFDHVVRNGVKVYANLNNMSVKTKELLLKNGFLTHFGIQNRIEDTYNTTIRFFKSNVNNEGKIDKYIYEELFSSISQKTSPEFLNEIYENLWEIIHNVIDHSKSSYLFMCGQHYPRKPFGTKNGMVSFAISDIGIGLLENIKSKIKIKEDREAFKWAFEEGTTTKEKFDGGLGLFEIKDKLSNKGRVLVVANQGYYKISKTGVETFKPFPFDIPGTLVVITLFLDECLKTSNESDIIEKGSKLIKEDDFFDLFI